VRQHHHQDLGARSGQLFGTDWQHAGRQQPLDLRLGDGGDAVKTRPRKLLRLAFWPSRL
jgi:hypothetical protein